MYLGLYLARVFSGIFFILLCAQITFQSQKLRLDVKTENLT